MRHPARVLLAVVCAVFAFPACQRPPTPKAAEATPTPSPTPADETEAALLTATATASADEFLGVWSGVDGDNDEFNILILPEGRAVSNWVKGETGARGERGLWRIQGADLLVFWANGWTDRIRRAGDTYADDGFRPGMALSDPPAGSTPTHRLDGEMAMFSGIWRLSREPDGSFPNIALQSDGEAFSTIPGNGKGTWKVEHGGARVRWEDGWEDAILPSAEGYRRMSWAPGMDRGAAPTIESEAIRVGDSPAAAASKAAVQ